jgi:hypothetical protein
MSLAPRGLAVPTAEDVRKIIADRCAKVGRFAMACEGVAAIVGSRGEAGGCWGYWGLDFAFERTTKRLSFECDGIADEIRICCLSKAKANLDYDCAFANANRMRSYSDIRLRNGRPFLIARNKCAG